MPVTKWDIEEQVQKKADEIALEVYGDEYYALPLDTRCKITEEAATFVKEKWEEGLIRLKEALDDR